MDSSKNKECGEGGGKGSDDVCGGEESGGDGGGKGSDDVGGKGSGGVG